MMRFWSLAVLLLTASLAVAAPEVAPDASGAGESAEATSGPASAAPAERAIAAPRATLDAAQEKAIQQAFEKRFPGIPVSAVRTTPLPGLFEVQVGMDLVYADAAVNYVLQGSLIDARAKRDLTAERVEALQKVVIDSLPLDDAIRMVKGKGTRKLVTFEDPNCPYCKQLHHTLEGIDDVTVYVFLFPILSADSNVKSRDIWCADDRAQAWRAWMLDGRQPEEAQCDTPLQNNLALGRQLNVQGTPALFFEDGSRVNGALPLDALKERLAAVDTASE